MLSCNEELQASKYALAQLKLYNFPTIHPSISFTQQIGKKETNLSIDDIPSLSVEASSSFTSNQFQNLHDILYKFGKIIHGKVIERSESTDNLITIACSVLYNGYPIGLINIALWLLANVFSDDKSELSECISKEELFASFLELPIHESAQVAHSVVRFLNIFCTTKEKRNFIFNTLQIPFIQSLLEILGTKNQAISDLSKLVVSLFSYPLDPESAISCLQMLALLPVENFRVTILESAFRLEPYIPNFAMRASALSFDSLAESSITGTPKAAAAAVTLLARMSELTADAAIAAITREDATEVTRRSAAWSIAHMISRHQAAEAFLREDVISVLSELADGAPFRVGREAAFALSLLFAESGEETQREMVGGGFVARIAPFLRASETRLLNGAHIAALAVSLSAGADAEELFELCGSELALIADSTDEEIAEAASALLGELEE